MVEEIVERWSRRWCHGRGDLGTHWDGEDCVNPERGYRGRGVCGVVAEEIMTEGIMAEEIMEFVAEKIAEFVAEEVAKIVVGWCRGL